MMQLTEKDAFNWKMDTYIDVSNVNLDVYRPGEALRFLGV
jgi:hypothetical protein